ncbi:VOC family protein [Pseudooceanicola sp. CBS1P-1]|uniref:VOC family protein n=1 Tax=Pseudooceanicola albus TaxID=2692189 RepID=A0A6L7GB29_9RHOB|nr:MULTISPECIES: VOC family protein [Pseudooceanicola]MBT9386362.1 VOC family protein [Pseudooceanicola endophyticus]MXN20480.1 VOC family protein [Pseudooceanicola albus]
MLSHVTLAVTDVEAARGFWGPLMARMGFAETWHVPGQEASYRDPALPRPLFFLTRPFEGDPDPGNGPMVGFLAKDRETVRAVHAMALATGAADAGAPELRTRYHPDYYGAYFRDPDGNKICIACHEAESA